MARQAINSGGRPAAGSLYLGVDGGGSKTRARLVDTNLALLGEGIAGPANAFQDLQQARASLREAALGALHAAGLPEACLGDLVVGAGLAGVNVPRLMAGMEAWEHPFARLYLATDIHIACLGAHGGGPGAVIVAGTGTVGYAQDAGASVGLGGHGFPCGDKGSGAWLGLEALRAALLALDGLGPQTRLLGLVEGQLGCSGLGLVEAMAGASSRDYGRLAPLVFIAAEQGDPVASALLADGAAYLSDMAAQLLTRPDTTLCLLGGLGERILPWLRAEIAARVVAPRGQPEEGAVLLASQQHPGDN